MIGRRYRRFVRPNRFLMVVRWSGRNPWAPVLMLFLVRLTLEKGL